jgi:hypothetical protein
MSSGKRRNNKVVQGGKANGINLMTARTRRLNKEEFVTTATTNFILLSTLPISTLKYRNVSGDELIAIKLEIEGEG